MGNFVKNLSDGGLAEDTYAFMERVLNEQPKSEMVNKQEFIEKVKRWLKFETDWDYEYDEEGRNPNYGKIDELVKYLEA